MLANTELLNLYYCVGRFISSNTRLGEWGTGAIGAISEQLQGEIPGLHGFSPSNMKNMRTFYEQWASEIEPSRQASSADLSGKKEIALIRQTVSAELDNAKAMAFCRIGFSHHREILRKCKTSEERWYYIFRCADEFWSFRALKGHLKADAYTAYHNQKTLQRRVLPSDTIIIISYGKTRQREVIETLNHTTVCDII